MQKLIGAISEKLEEAKKLGPIQAGKKTKLAESALDDTVRLLSEMAGRIEMLEGMQDGEID